MAGKPSKRLSEAQWNRLAVLLDRAAADHPQSQFLFRLSASAAKLCAGFQSAATRRRAIEAGHDIHRMITEEKK